MNKSPHLSVPFIEKLDEMDLSQVAQLLEEKGRRCSIENINWKDQFPYTPLTTFSIAHSETAIYVDFFVRCNYLRAVNYEDNSHVHEDSCVEFFVSPAPYDFYWNFEFNCIGTISASKRRSRQDHTPLTTEQLAKVRRYASCGNRPFDEVEGLFAWNLTVAIPLELLGLKYEPGKPIDLRANFYKCADLCTQAHFLSWAPIDTPEPDFHRPEFFGTVTLE